MCYTASRASVEKFSGEGATENKDRKKALLSLSQGVDGNKDRKIAKKTEK